MALRGVSLKLVRAGSSLSSGKSFSISTRSLTTSSRGLASTPAPTRLPSFTTVGRSPHFSGSIEPLRANFSSLTSGSNFEDSPLIRRLRERLQEKPEFMELTTKIIGNPELMKAFSDHHALLQRKGFIDMLPKEGGKSLGMMQMARLMQKGMMDSEVKDSNMALLEHMRRAGLSQEEFIPFLKILKEELTSPPPP